MPESPPRLCGCALTKSTEQNCPQSAKLTQTHSNHAHAHVTRSGISPAVPNRPHPTSRRHATRTARHAHMHTCRGRAIRPPAAPAHPFDAARLVGRHGGISGAASARHRGSGPYLRRHGGSSRGRCGMIPSSIAKCEMQVIVTQLHHHWC